MWKQTQSLIDLVDILYGIRVNFPVGSYHTRSECETHGQLNSRSKEKCPTHC